MFYQFTAAEASASKRGEDNRVVGNKYINLEGRFPPGVRKY